MKIIDASIEAILPYPKEMVHRLVSAPALIADWHPSVEQVRIFEQKGLLYRKAVLLDDGAELFEKCWSEQEDVNYHFQAVQGLWAEAHYRSKIRLDECGDGCKVTWQGRLMSPSTGREKERMQEYYKEGLRGLDASLRHAQTRLSAKESRVHC